MTFDALLASIDAPMAALVVMSVIVIATVVSWHRTKDGFDLSQCIVDSTTQRIAPEKVGFMTVLAIMTWGFVALILQGKLTEWYAGLYGGMFVAGRFGSQYLSTKKDIASVTPGDTK